MQKKKLWERRCNRGGRERDAKTRSTYETFKHNCCNMHPMAVETIKTCY
jgi:hypothetical protein